MKPYTVTYCGKSIDLVQPNVSAMSIDTFAMQMSKICRFTGAVEGWYSVARHCTIGAKAFHRLGDVENARRFMLHDAHEALYGDIATPVANAINKRRIAILKLNGDEAVGKRFGVDLRFGIKPIKEMDAELLYREWVRLMPDNPSKHGIEMPDKTRIPEDLCMSIHGRSDWQRDYVAYVNFADFLGLK